MEKNKSQRPNPEHENEVEQLKAWLSNYGSHAITVVLAVLIVLAGLNLFKSRTARLVNEANQRLANAQSVSDFEGILADFGKSDIAPLAQLALAKRNFDNANYELALTQYDQFLAKWPDHQLKETAELGRIFCIEARGNADALSEAADRYAAFTTDHPEHYLAPQAKFGQARCLEQLGQPEKARTIYEDFITTQPDNLWTMRAEELLVAVERDLDKQKTKTEEPQS